MEKNLLIQSVRDFFTAPMLKISFLPFIISVIAMYLLFFSAADAGLTALQHGNMHLESTTTTIVNGVPHTQTEVTDVQGAEGELGVMNGIVQFLMAHTLTSWLVSFFVYTIGTVFTLLVSVMLAVIIVGFLSPIIIKTIQKKHYPQVDVAGFATPLDSILHLLKTTFIMFFLLLILMPLYFIPLLNVIAFNLPFYYFFHKMINYDVGSTICTKGQFALLNLEYKNRFRFTTLLLFLLSLIPFVALFGSAFFIIYLSHHYFSLIEKEQLTYD